MPGPRHLVLCRRLGVASFRPGYSILAKLDGCDGVARVRARFLSERDPLGGDERRRHLSSKLGVLMAVAPWIVSDKLWELVEPLLPKTERRFRYPGRKRFPDRQALQGILFVLHTGIAWTQLPAELGLGSGVTCWRRLDQWQRVCGSSCTRFCLLGCGLPASLSGRARSPTPVRCRRKRGLRNGPEPG